MEQKRSKGHPRSFKDEQEFIDTFNRYIATREEGELANVAGFCVYADINKDTFYAQKEYYSDAFKKVNNILEDKTINNRAINDTFKIFYMKNKFGYKDRQEIEANVSNNEYSKLSLEELKKLAGE